MSRLVSPAVAAPDPTRPFRTPDGRFINFANDPRVVSRIKEHIIPMVNLIRQRREPLNNMWRSLFKVWSLEHEEEGYIGRSHIYMPAGRKGVETLVPQLVGGTFPGDDNFSVSARRQEWMRDAQNVTEVLKYYIDTGAKVRHSADRFYRQMVITGNSPVKIYNVRKVAGGTGRRNLAALEFMPDIASQVLYNGPVFDTIDIQNFYVFPENANDLQDAMCVFEDLTVSAGDLFAKTNRGIYNRDAVVKACRGGSRIPEKDMATQATLEAQGIQSPHDVRQGIYMPLDLTEIWIEFDPYGDEKNNKYGDPYLCLIVVCNGEVLRCIRNPFWHQRFPYVLGRMGTVVGRIYGTGYVEAIQQLNILLNSQTNQGMDAITYALNPVTISDPNLIHGALPDIEPGVQFLVADINRAVRFDRPDTGIIQAVSTLSTQVQAWINDFIGAPPVLQGGSSPGRAFRTATGIGTAQQNATRPLQEVIKLCEAEVFEPMLYMFWALSHQFMDEPLSVYLTGQTTPTMIEPDQLTGDWMFKWAASTQTANQQVKGSQIVEFLSLMSSPAMTGLMQQNGMRLNPAPLIKRLFQEVYGFKNVDDVVVQATLAATAPPGAAPGAPPEVGGGPPGDMPPGMDPSMVAGTDMDADAISAMLGQLGASGVSQGGEDST